MSVTIGINGFGRIGRSLTRIVCAQPEGDITIGAINDLATIDRLAYGLRRDSIRGTFPGTVTVRGDHLVVNDRAIRTYSQPKPERIRWADAGVDVVIEATGRFRSGDAARRHITHGGARKVVISASADHPDALLVYGANHHTYDSDRHDVVSPASCGVNALTVTAPTITIGRWDSRRVNCPFGPRIRSRSPVGRSARSPPSRRGWATWRR